MAAEMHRQLDREKTIIERIVWSFIIITVIRSFSVYSMQQISSTPPPFHILIAVDILYILIAVDILYIPIATYIRVVDSFHILIAVDICTVYPYSSIVYTCCSFILYPYCCWYTLYPYSCWYIPYHYCCWYTLYPYSCWYIPYHYCYINFLYPCCFCFLYFWFLDSALSLPLFYVVLSFYSWLYSFFLC